MTPVAGVSVVCGILAIPPATVKKFRTLWLTLIKNWKVTPGPVYQPGKLRILTLDEYRAEMGTSPAVAEAPSPRPQQAVLVGVGGGAPFTYLVASTQPPLRRGSSSLTRPGALSGEKGS